MIYIPTISSNGHRHALKSVGQLVTLLTLLLSLAGESGQDEIITNTNISESTNTEKIKIGNSKTNNYNVHHNNYAPQQLTQVLLNVPKTKKTRRNRPPTQEEYAIKRKILDVFEEAKNERLVKAEPEFTQHTDHLERILRALNPKYIATERVYRVAFADPSDPSASNPLPDLPEYSDSHNEESSRSSAQKQSPERLKLDIGGRESVEEQLERVDETFSDLVWWTSSFMEKLANTADELLTSQQIAYKRLLLCLSDESECPTNTDVMRSVRKPMAQSESLSPTTKAIAASAISQISDAIATKVPPQALELAEKTFDRVVAPQEPLEVSASNVSPSIFIELPREQIYPQEASWNSHNDRVPMDSQQRYPRQPLPQQVSKMMRLDHPQSVYSTNPRNNELMYNRQAPIEHRYQSASSFHTPPPVSRSKGLKLTGLRIKGQMQRLLSR